MRTIPNPCRKSLELPLRQSARLRLARRWFGFSILLYALELLVTGHWLAVLGVLPVAAGLWFRRRTNHADPERLLLAADGRLFLQCAGGSLQQVHLRPESLALGSHLLLVLRGEHHSIRLLFGPDNLAPCELAALKRRLPFRAAQPTGVHSVAAPGSKPSQHP